MDHLTFAQLLGNYGEFVGAIAVVVTLFYLALQIKQNTHAITESRIATQNSFYSEVQLTELQKNELLLNQAELVTRANSGIDLEESDRYKLRVLYRNSQTTFFFRYGIQRNLGDDGRVAAHNFARHLLENPAMLEIWREEIADQSMFAGIPNDGWKSWTDCVEQQVVSLGGIRVAS